MADQPVQQAEPSDTRQTSVARAALLVGFLLAIGKVVPDIEGNDTDGVTFKLSDYRGKVVMLDYWGHW